MIDKKTNMIRINIMWPEELLERIQKAAKKNGTNASNLIRMLVVKGLKELEKDD